MSKVLSPFPAETRPGSHGDTLAPGPQTAVPGVPGEITAAIDCFSASGNLEQQRVMLAKPLKRRLDKQLFGNHDASPDQAPDAT